MHAHVVSNRKAIVAMLVVLLAGFGLELVGGWVFNSLGVMSDAFHMLSDGMAQATFLIVYSIMIWQRSVPDWLHSMPMWILRFCSKKEQDLERIGNWINLWLLVVAAAYTLVMAVIHLHNHERVEDPQTTLIIAFIGLTVNIINLGIFVANKGAKESMRSVFLHVLTDAAISVVVILSLLLFIWQQQLWWMDSVLSIVVSLWMLYLCWGLLRELLNGRSFDLARMGVRITVLPYRRKACDHDHSHDHHQGHDHNH